jgi:hypothetical protein
MLTDGQNLLSIISGLECWLRCMLGISVKMLIGKPVF